MAAIAMAGILLQGVLAAFGPSENPRERRVKLSFDEQFAKESFASSSMAPANLRRGPS